MYFFKSIPVRFLFIFICCNFPAHIPIYAQHFTTIKTHDGVEISENGKKVLSYQQRLKSLNGKYERAGYVHPLYSLNEKVLTEDFPDDHPYHHGIFWAWHQVILNDKNIADGWTYENIFWVPVSLKIKEKKESIMLQSEMIWQSVLEKNKLTDIVKENTKITMHKSTPQYRAIDFDIHLSALVDGLKLGGSNDAKGYGGFCLRLKLPDDISFLSNGRVVTPLETAVTAGPWMDFLGSFDGSSVSKTGIAVFCRQPGSNDKQLWILRKEKSMQNVPYPGRTPLSLPAKGWRLQYRLIIHNENMTTDELEKLYQQYIHQF